MSERPQVPARVALVTGGGHGIGRATAARLARAGHHVVIADIDLGAARVVEQSLIDEGFSAAAHELDVASEASWSLLSEKLRSDPPSLIVSNAYNLVVKPSWEQTEAEWTHQISVTLSAAYRAVHAFHDSLVSQRGAIVLVSSVHALAGWPGHAAYAAAKGGLLSLARQMAVELAPLVRVNSVIPGSIDTRVWDSTTPEIRAQAERQSVLRRLGTGDEVAAAITFLLSDDASYITGTSLVVDGGQTARVF